MSTDLRHEIKQQRPFQSLEQELLLNIARTAAVLGNQTAEWLRAFGVTPTQFNVLRILRGAGADGLCRHEVRARMISPDPDVTRLLDRLEEAALIERERDRRDRRQVRARITAEGLALLDRLDDAIVEHHRAQVGHLPASDQRRLIALLSAARAGPG